VFSKQDRPRFEDEDAFRPAGAAEPQMLGDGGAERAAADDDEIERPHVAARRQGISVHVPRVGAIGRIGIGERFVKRVADVSPEHVECEVSRLRGRADIHVALRSRASCVCRTMLH